MRSFQVDYDEDFDFQPNDEVEEILERASKEPKEEQENGDDGKTRMRLVDKLQV